MPVVLLTCPVQHYAWGSTSSIPRLQRQDNPEQLPWAESWMGTHSRGGSTLANGQSLADYIAEAPRARLGGLGQGQELPFLFKILAAAAPLSIQCHPNREQAEAGYQAEQTRGVPLDAPHRNYRDRNHKPELIVALEEFWALKGFREPTRIRELFSLAGVKSLSPLLDLLAEENGLRTFYQGLLSLDVVEKDRALKELTQGLDALPEAEARWTREFLRRYPGDISASSALILELVKLDAGQALYLDAGELHAYLQGTGLEIMANSDNVLRGGLTPKHVAPKELMRILQFSHRPLRILSPEPASPTEPSRLRYATPCKEFALSCLPLEPGRRYRHELRSASILLSLDGATEIQWQNETLRLPQGQAAFCTADTGTLTLGGQGQLWIASISDSPASPIRAD